MKQDELKNLFIRKNALLSGHFKLSSGLHSNMYFQSALIFQYPKDTVYLARELANKIKENNIEFDVIVSPAIGGIVFGYEVGRAFNVRAIFTERVDGLMSLRRGFNVKEWEKILVVEDVITTGLSTREVINALKFTGSEVVAVVSLVDRSDGKVNFGIPRFSLLSLEINSYKEEECPMCKDGSQLIKHGSRK
ncbi:MAG: orotate phosphoribosyltransferase [Endomicrobium sp.]|jgi:orotate phosphoribosyltransferase|nr:orotate phosphoribosyltransferase [Endomicrobium sp.]